MSSSFTAKDPDTAVRETDVHPVAASFSYLKLVKESFSRHHTFLDYGKALPNY